MRTNYEELDYCETPLGGLMLRRRRLLQLGGAEIYEVKLGKHFLMSSLFHQAESQLAKLALAELDGEAIDVVVGGLGLGFTAASVLEDPRVESLVVVEYLEAVIEWHRERKVPLAETLMADPRCRFVHADFFALSRDVTRSFDPEDEDKLHDAVLVDIDHTPTHLLHPSNRRFYEDAGLREVAQHLRAGGVFALWSDGAPGDAFLDRVDRAFGNARTHEIAFQNPLTEGRSNAYVVIARSCGEEGDSRDGPPGCYRGRRGEIIR
jgi:spermidine synthase